MIWINAIAPAVALALGGVGGAAPAVAADLDALRPLLGSWAGHGGMKLQKDKAEKVRCNAYNTFKTGELRMVIKCASISYKVEIRSKMTHRAGHLAGRWEERTYNANGDITGSIKDGQLRLAISGGGFTGDMTVMFTANSQLVSIATEGINLRSVNVELGKASPGNRKGAKASQ